MNPSTPTTSKPRRTSVSSQVSRTSRASTKSWRIPLAKQAPRTQLSAVFAESAIPVSRSPAGSALEILERRYNSSSSNSLGVGGSTLSVSPSNADGLRVSSGIEPALMEAAEVDDANSAQNIGKGVENDNSSLLRRGRQATQRHISLTGDSESLTSPSSNSFASTSQISIPQVTVNGLPDLVKPVENQAAASGMDWQPTPSVNEGTISIDGRDESRKRTQTMSSWFGSSGRAKAQKIQPSLPIADEPSSTAPPLRPTLDRDATIIAPVPTATHTAELRSSSSWFSRSKTSTPAPVPTPQPAPPPQILLPSETAAPAPPTITIPNQPLTTVVHESPAASPSRNSWFGVLGKSPLQSSSSSTRGTPAISPLDLPNQADEEIDESMLATVTPATFASQNPNTHSRNTSQALSTTSQPLTSNRAVPTTWFRISGKRDSMTPSIDSHVPTLPPTPQRDHSPIRTTLVPIDVLMPLASPSFSTLGSSSARYGLSFGGYGRGDARSAVGSLRRFEGEAKAETFNDWVLVLKQPARNPNVETQLITTRRQAPSPIRPPPPMHSEPAIEEMVLDTNDTAENGSSAASIASSQPPPSAWWPFGWGVPFQDQHTEPHPNMTGVQESSTGAQAPLPSPNHDLERENVTAAGSGNVQQGPNSAPWFGLWPWETNTVPKTEAELVKEEAMARDRTREGLPTPPHSTETIRPSASAQPSASSSTQPFSPSLSDMTPRPQDYSRNPIAQDVLENRASWTSFFSLRAAHGAKRITDGEDQMEVMDLSGDPDLPPTPAPASPSVKGKGLNAGKAVNPALAKASGASTPAKRSSSAGPMKKDSSADLKKKALDTTKGRSSSATPSKRSATKAPNMVLPTFEETFYTLPRALPPYTRPTSLKKMGKLVSGVLGINTESGRRSRMREWQREKGVVVPRDYEGLRASREVGRDFPRVGEVLGVNDVGGIRECKRIAILGVHGWFPGTIMRTLLGEPTGTSPKFASMMETAVKEFMDAHGVTPEKITSMPLEGEGTIEKRVEKLYQDFLAKKEWVEDLHEADVIFVATHSQGAIVSTQLLDRFIQDGHIRTSKNWEIVRTVADTAANSIGITIPPPRPPQRVCCLSLCGIHLGPLLYLGTSSLVNPYIQYFESAAAKELFEFQDTEAEVSKRYQAALENVLDHGAKFVYVASLDDQVVPIYSGVFTAVTHPRILRALYIDGDAYNSSDFLSNLLVLLLKLRNAGVDDGGLLMHLSEATAGSLSGVGHSTAYLDPGAYKLAVRFLFETSDALGDDPKFDFEHFTAKASRNDYEIPWALRGLMTDPQTQELFGKELEELRRAFDGWQPKTSALKEVRKKLEPIRGRKSRFAQDSL